MNILINLKHEDGTKNVGPVELHGPNGFIAGWDMSVIHEAIDTSAKKCISLDAVARMCDAAYAEGKSDRSKELRKLLGA